jgi:phosphoribosyl-ATP pyrophosphohydrolase/phosphoribosyl-AMP cyclohydrolase
VATAPAEDSTAEQLVFDEHGLLPCIAQDSDSGEVLMHAYMNREALERTLETGELHFWSRSRRQMWRKGETSGNVMRVCSLRLDCDGDCLLALVEPAGPACHTGQRTCFFRELAPLAASDGFDGERGPHDDASANPTGDADWTLHEAIHEAPTEALPALERTLASRARERPAGSYTVALLEDPPRIGEKVMEEAEEVARAAREESEERVDEEAADLLYHLLVLLHSRGRRLADAAHVLIDRSEGKLG